MGNGEINCMLNSELVAALGKEYISLFRVDCRTNLITAFRRDDRFCNGEDQRNVGTLSDYLRKYAEGVCPEDRDIVLSFCDFTHIMDSFKNRRSFSVRVRISEEEMQYNRIHFIRGEAGEDGKDGDFILVGFLDITDDEDLRDYYSYLESEKQKLEEKEQELVAANNAKTVFLNNMSHDIRTPMNAILGYARMMEKEIYHPVVIENYLKKIVQSGEYLLTILNNVLDLARIDSGKLGLDEDRMDVFRDSVNIDAIFADSLKKKNLTLIPTMNIEHRYVLADSHKLGQIMVNLVGNAVKYTPEGGTIRLDFSEYPLEREGYARFVTTVSDTGVGMSKEFQKHIFDSFTRERNTTESNIVGSGLGMAIVKQLVDMMNGTIEIESEIGKGTTIRIINIHKYLDAPEEYVEEIPESGKGTPQFAGKRILLAEDNDLNAEIAQTILESMDLMVEWAKDGLECIHMLDVAPAGYYDLILMDIQMPHMDGYMATKKIRLLPDKEKAQIPILAMTANAFEEDKQNAVNAGMNGHIAKPIDMEKLTEALESVLCGQ